MNHSKIELLWAMKVWVFTIEDLALYWGMVDLKDISQLAGYYVRQKRIFRLKGGLFSLLPKPEYFLVAQKAFTPSYISAQSALKYHGIIFQSYDFISSASVKRRRIVVQNVLYEYHQFPKSIFFNTLGLVKQDGFTVASPERAIIDSLYLNTSIGFDNLDSVNRDLLLEIAKLYNQPKIWKSLEFWFPEFKGFKKSINNFDIDLNQLIHTYAH